MFGNEEKTELNNVSDVDPNELKAVKIIFKHGGEFIVKCKNFIITECGSTISEYDINGICGDYPLYICTDEIAAILYLREGENSPMGNEYVNGECANSKYGSFSTEMPERLKEQRKVFYEKNFPVGNGKEVTTNG